MSRKNSFFVKIRKIIYNYYKVRNYYIQMRLPVEKITKDFEEMLRDKIAHNIIHADIREATKEDADIIINVYKRAWRSTIMHVPIILKKNY